jgi:hypothetical protein
MKFSMKGGLIHVWIWWLRRWLWLWRLRSRWRFCFNYSIVYLVNYHWCSYLELKKALKKGLFFRRWVCFICCIVYFINYCWNNLLVLYLESLDLPLKNVVEGSTKYAFFKSFSRSSNPVNHFYIS